MAAIPRLQFLEDVFNVLIYGRQRNAQPAGDRTIRQTIPDTGQYLKLAGRQSPTRRRRRPVQPDDGGDLRQQEDSV
jgi:hypothetical protein